MCVRAKSLQLCLTLCDPKDCSPPGSALHGLLLARILERVTISSPGDLPDSRIEPVSLTSPALASGLVTTSTTWEAMSHVNSLIQNFCTYATLSKICIKEEKC